MKDYSFYKYNDGGYAIGEIGSDDYVTGLGYIYFSDLDGFSYGPFKSSENNGWVFTSADAEDDDKDTTYLYNHKNGHVTEGIIVTSNHEYISLDQTNKKGDAEGYSFIIYPDGSWRYQYIDDSNETRAVQFYADDEQFKMVYREKDKATWSKALDAGALDDDSYLLPFKMLKSETFPDAEFDVQDNFVQTEGNGPFVFFDEESDTTNIGIMKNQHFNGVIYSDTEDAVSISQTTNGKREGPHITIQKDSYNWIYSFFKNNERCSMSVNWFWDNGTLEIRNYKYTNEKVCDCVQIDKDFNVRFIEGFNEEKESMVDSKDYDYDEVYSGKDEDEEEQPKSKKVKTSKKDKAQDSDDDWADELRGLFK